MSESAGFSRKQLIVGALASLAAVGHTQGNASKPSDPSDQDLKALESIFGFELTDEERKAIREELRGNLAASRWVHEQKIPYTVDPSTVFTPVGGAPRKGRVQAKPANFATPLPTKEADFAFASLHDLGRWLRSGKITSVELTKMYLKRLKTYGERLQAVVTLTEDLALAQAAKADAEMKAGKIRGPLHGIPYGIKDLFATKGIRTTWGAGPYKTQVPDFDATVVKRLEEAGAVLVAKLTLGALAMGDVWFGGTTKNPWNEKQGSSGSSAGSAAATAAGLVAFAIGTETYGSITSPSLRCRVTGHRPTYGRVSRYGGMELSYTMDKVGPICRSAEDCALVFAAICGEDPKDASASSSAFEFPKRVDYKKLRVGYVGNKDRMAKDPVVQWFQKQGSDVKEAVFTPMPEHLLVILTVESSSAFEELTRTGEIREMKGYSSWPEIFRAARYLTAVDYLQLQRARTQALQKFHEEFSAFDVLVMDGLGGTITHTNLGGHPQVMLPWGDDGKGNSLGKSLVGHLYQDDFLLTVARDLQREFDYSRRRPPAFS